MFYRIFNYFFGNSIRQGKGQQSPLPSSNPYESSISLPIDSALQVSSVWACIQILVETIGSLPLSVYVLDDSGEKIVDKKSTIHRVIHTTPNSRNTPQEFWEYMLMNLFLRGNAYARISRNVSGSVIALWPLSSDQMVVAISDAGEFIYSYTSSNKDHIYLDEDILHIKGIGNGIVGLSALDYMKSSVGLAIKSQDHMYDTFKNKSRRPGILMTDRELTPDQRKVIHDNFSNISKHPDEEFYVLESHFKFQPLGMTPSDLQLLETRKFAVEDIARWFGVPSVLINDISSSSVWGSGIEKIIQGFYKFRIRPQLKRIEQSIDKKLFSSEEKSLGYSVEYNFDALLRASLSDRMDIYAKAVQNGLKTRNECRFLENDPALDGGDILTAQVNLAPLDLLGKTGGIQNVNDEIDIAQ